MFRNGSKVAFILVATLIAAALLSVPLGATAQGNNEAAQLCEDEGYLNFTDANGQVFKNAGQCARYAAQGNTLMQRVTPCEQEALDAGFDPDSFNIIAGTTGNDVFGDDDFTDGADLICGFGGDDYVYPSLYEGDVFLGGPGNDTVYILQGGAFYGGEGYDQLVYVDILSDNTYVPGPQENS